ncbi:MAG TPA: hypothetical protein VHR35_12015 [Nocardioides sp.]|jgi:hypothetical protein|nr:hypothetical protein [Nocardioides sp.]
MSATFTHQNHRVPLAALAVAGVIAAGGVLGVAWQQSGDSAAPAEAPEVRTPTAQDYGKYNYYHGPHSRSVERHQTFPDSPSGGRVQLGD